MSTNFCIKYLVLKLDQIRHLHIELSSKCQAACPLCMRNLYGYYERPDYPKVDLTLTQIKTIFDKADLDIHKIYYNGNFGDPCINTELGDITEYFYNRFPNCWEIGVSTNGGMQKPEWWYNLGQRFKNRRFRIDFSIEGLEDTNHLYRVGVPYNKVIENAKAFITGGGVANWKWIDFKHNQHQKDTAQQLSKDLGFDMFIVADHGRDDGYVKTNDGHYLIEPSDSKNKQGRIPLPAVKNGDHVAYEKFMSDSSEDYRETKERSWQQHGTLDCHHMTEQSVYINSIGELYPCCLLGFNPRTYVWEYNKQLNEILKNFNNNLLEVDWTTAVKWFDVVYEGWRQETVANGMIQGCIMLCHHPVINSSWTKN